MTQEITYRNRGFHNYEATVGDEVVARLSTTFGVHTKRGNYNIYLLREKRLAYAMTLEGAKQTIQESVDAGGAVTDAK